MLPHLERRLGPDHPDTLAAAEWIDNISNEASAAIARLVRFFPSVQGDRIAAWRPRPSGRGRNAASPPRKCQC